MHGKVIAVPECSAMPKSIYLKIEMMQVQKLSEQFFASSRSLVRLLGSDNWNAAVEQFPSAFCI